MTERSKLKLARYQKLRTCSSVTRKASELIVILLLEALGTVHQYKRRHCAVSSPMSPRAEYTTNLAGVMRV